MYLKKQQNLLLLMIALLFSNSIMAQLTVKNDNYIFVDDEVLYVNDDVKLEHSASKIYLRNEAQLVQGSGTTGNSGVGELSAQQNGNSNQYLYNYWCSPVGNIDSNTSTNNPFKVNLIDEATGLITSSDANFTTEYDGSSSPLTISSAWLWIYLANNGYGNWVYVGSDGDIAPGLGFTMKGTSGSSNNQLYDFRGKPNNGTISNAVESGSWTLVGNPYASALDARDFIHDSQNSSNITGALYYWEQQNSQTSHYGEDFVGGYASYTISADGTPSFTPATFSAFNGNGDYVDLPESENGVKQAGRYIPIGQGFMVVGTANGMVHTKNEHREYYKQSNSDSFFFNPENETVETIDKSVNDAAYSEDGLSIVSEDYKRFRINVILNETYTRQLMQNFHATATEGFDYGLEAESPKVLSNDAYWTQDNKPFVIQANKFDINLTIPLILDIEKQQPIIISIFDVQRFDDAQEIFIYDNENDSYVNLRTQNFEINLSSGTYEDRFSIRFKKKEALSSTDYVFDNFSVFQNNTTNELIIKNPNNLDIKLLQLYDITGKEILTINELGNQSIIKHSTKNISSGVYLSTITTKENHTITKKIIIN
ncbi:MAG: T9SS type A sorting domain-containing protein [Flavobacteriaceae bacterium]|nr:T9SS type A sorting domain-containing protein [Flavobacteriaceae bacterium]